MSLFLRKKIAFLTMLALIVGSAALLTLNAQAQERDYNDQWIDDDHPVVIELFTSTNCSACVQADRILYDVGRKKNVITLGCHVEYWDENTAFDPAGFEECSYRQWAYRSSRMVSGTKIEVPYFMINGDINVRYRHINSFYRTLLSLKRSARQKPLWIGLKWLDQETITITLPEVDYELDEDDSYSVWLIRYKDQLIKKVEEGVTAGRVLRFTNIVQRTEHIGKWHGEKRDINLVVGAPPSGEDAGGYVAMIQKMNGSETVAAGKVSDYLLETPEEAAERMEKELQEIEETIDTQKDETVTPPAAE